MIWMLIVKEKKPKKPKYPKNNKMSVIFLANHEVGNLTEYSSSSGADISVAAGAALAGTSYGMNILVDDGTADYAYKTFSPVNTSGKVRARFYYDPNGLSISNYGNFEILQILGNGQTIGVIYKNIGGTYYITGAIYDDAGAATETTAIAISDAQHYIEVYLQRAASDVSSDGRIDIWVDGASQQTVTGIDNYDRFVNLFRVLFGMRSLSGTISGTIYLDELIVNDDGGLIGPVITGKPNNFMLYKRMRSI